MSQPIDKFIAITLSVRMDLFKFISKSRYMRIAEIRSLIFLGSIPLKSRYLELLNGLITSITDKERTSNTIDISETVIKFVIIASNKCMIEIKGEVID